MRKLESVGGQIDAALGQIYHARSRDQEGCQVLQPFEPFESDLDDDCVTKEVESVRHPLQGTPWQLQNVDVVDCL